MSEVVAFDDVKSRQFESRGSLRTPFLNHFKEHKTSKAAQELAPVPVAFISSGDPDRVIEPHYHVLDEFIIVTEGGGKLGRMDVAPYSVFFARAHTPYGPIIAGSKTGISFFVLFSRFDPGAEYIPQSMAKLKEIPNRRPWQIKRPVNFPAPERAAAPGAVILEAIPDIVDDQGLAAYSLTMAPNTHTTAPDPRVGDGQYLVVVKGSLLHDGRECKAYTVVFTKPHENAFAVHAGPEGLQAIILNYPQTKPHAAAPAAVSSAAGYKKWQCELCSFMYDEALGLPDDGIAPGTRWEDVPKSWTCPDCAATKSDFKMAAVG